MYLIVGLGIPEINIDIQSTMQALWYWTICFCPQYQYQQDKHKAVLGEGLIGKGCACKAPDIYEPGRKAYELITGIIAICQAYSGMMMWIYISEESE